MISLKFKKTILLKQDANSSVFCNLIKSLVLMKAAKIDIK